MYAWDLVLESIHFANEVFNDVLETLGKNSDKSRRVGVGVRAGMIE